MSKRSLQGGFQFAANSKILRWYECADARNQQQQDAKQVGEVVQCDATSAEQDLYDWQGDEVIVCTEQGYAAQGTQENAQMQDEQVAQELEFESAAAQHVWEYFEQQDEAITPQQADEEWNEAAQPAHFEPQYLGVIDEPSIIIAEFDQEVSEFQNGNTVPQAEFSNPLYVCHTPLHQWVVPQYAALPSQYLITIPQPTPAASRPPPLVALQPTGPTQRYVRTAPQPGRVLAQLLRAPQINTTAQRKLQRAHLVQDFAKKAQLKFEQNSQNHDGVLMLRLTMGAPNPNQPEHQAQQTVQLVQQTASPHVRALEQAIAQPVVQVVRRPPAAHPPLQLKQRHAVQVGQPVRLTPQQLADQQVEQISEKPPAQLLEDEDEPDMQQQNHEDEDNPVEIQQNQEDEHFRAMELQNRVDKVVVQHNQAEADYPIVHKRPESRDALQGPPYLSIYPIVEQRNQVAIENVIVEYLDQNVAQAQHEEVTVISDEDDEAESANKHSVLVLREEEESVGEQAEEEESVGKQAEEEESVGEQTEEESVGEQAEEEESEDEQTEEDSVEEHLEEKSADEVLEEEESEEETSDGSTDSDELDEQQNLENIETAAAANMQGVRHLSAEIDYDVTSDVVEHLEGSDDPELDLEIQQAVDLQLEA